MKKIINGRMYNTDTAHAVGEWNDSYPNDFHYVCETLYRKRNGEYFIHGEGGAMSKYAQSCGQNQWSGGEQIIPLTYDSARDWAEKNLDADEYEAEFGEVSEDGEGEFVVVSLRMTSMAKVKLDRLASKTGKSRGDIITDAIMGME